MGKVSFENAKGWKDRSPWKSLRSIPGRRDSPGKGPEMGYSQKVAGIARRSVWLEQKERGTERWEMESTVEAGGRW